MEDRDRTVTLPDGRLLGYVEWGEPSGPPVLYFHGTPASRLDPVCFPDAPATAGVRLISIDRPAMGLSTFQPLTGLCLKAPPLARFALGTVLRLSRAKPDQAFGGLRSEVSESDRKLNHAGGVDFARWTVRG